MRTGVVAFVFALSLSVIIHVLAVVGGVVLLAPPRPLEAAPAPTVAVDLVTPEELAQLSKVELPSSEPAKPLAPAAQPAPTPAAPAQPTQPPQPQAAQPRPAPATPAQPQPAPAAQPQPQPQPQPSPARQAAAPAPAQSPFDPTQLASLFRISPVADLTESRAAESTSSGFEAPADSTAKLSAEDVAAFKTHLKKCMALPAGVSATDKLKVVLRVMLKPDGALRAQPMLLEATASPHGPAVVQSVMSALQQCQPYSFLPAAKYTEWKVLDVSFSPRDMAGG
jgi:hypothetical protein